MKKHGRSLLAEHALSVLKAQNRPIFATRASPMPPVGQSQILELEDYKAAVGDLNQTAISGHSLASYIGEMSVSNSSESRRSQEYGVLQKFGLSSHS